MVRPDSLRGPAAASAEKNLPAPESHRQTRASGTRRFWEVGCSVVRFLRIAPELEGYQGQIRRPGIGLCLLAGPGDSHRSCGHSFNGSAIALQNDSSPAVQSRRTGDVGCRSSATRIYSRLVFTSTIWPSRPKAWQVQVGEFCSIPEEATQFVAKPYQNDYT
jgi:hypothetical protein